MSTDQKIEEILQIVQEERKLNNSRFNQLSGEVKGLTTGFNHLSGEVKDIKIEVHGIKQDMGLMKKELKEEINKVYTSLSQDIQVFAEDLQKVKKRVDKIEKKIA